MHGWQTFQEKPSWFRPTNMLTEKMLTVNRLIVECLPFPQYIWKRTYPDSYSFHRWTVLSVRFFGLGLVWFLCHSVLVECVSFSSLPICALHEITTNFYRTSEIFATFHTPIWLNYNLFDWHNTNNTVSLKCKLYYCFYVIILEEYVNLDNAALRPH